MRFAAWLALPVLAGLGISPVMAAAPAPSFSKDIKPFLSNYCVECHQGNRAKAGVTLDTYQAIMKGDRKGRSLVIPGKPDNSRLLHTMEGKAKPMPPKKSQQPTAQEIAKLRAWIAAGAKDDPKGGVKPVGLKIGLPDREHPRSAFVPLSGIRVTATADPQTGMGTQYRVPSTEYPEPVTADLFLGRLHPFESNTWILRPLEE